MGLLILAVFVDIGVKIWYTVSVKIFLFLSCYTSFLPLRSLLCFRKKGIILIINALCSKLIGFFLGLELNT